MELGDITEVGLRDQTLQLKYLYDKIPRWFICEVNTFSEWEIKATGPGDWDYTDRWE